MHLMTMPVQTSAILFKGPKLKIPKFELVAGGKHSTSARLNFGPLDIGSWTLAAEAAVVIIFQVADV